MSLSSCEAILILNRVMTNIARCGEYYVYPPSLQDIIVAEHEYADAYNEGIDSGMITDDDLAVALISRGLWSDKLNEELGATPIKIDDLKLEMYKNYEGLKGKVVAKLRDQLTQAKNRYVELFRMRHSYDLYTVEGYAYSIKYAYLILKNVRDKQGNVMGVKSEDEGALIEEYLRGRIDDEGVRQLAKSDRWRMIWGASDRTSNVFGVSPILLSDEQKALVAWSKLYDNVGEHPNAPDKTVINDDDLLDGWIIAENRKDNKKGGMGGDKQPGHQEVYYVAETPEDAARINAMNNVGGQLTKQQRLEMLKSKGIVKEENFIDSQEIIMAQAMNRRRKGK